MSHCNLAHKFIPLPRAMKITDVKAAMDKEWKKLETIPAWTLGKVKSKKDVILEAQRDKKESPLCNDGHLSPQECEVRTKSTEVQRQSRAPRRHCKRRLWSFCSVYWTGLVWVLDDWCKSNGCSCKTTRLRRAADAVSANTQVKFEDAPRLLKIPNSECPDVWIGGKTPEIQRSSCSPRWYRKRRFRVLCAAFTEQGSSASHMTAAKIMDIISRLPGCAGQAADAVSAVTQVKMEDAHK